MRRGELPMKGGDLRFRTGSVSPGALFRSVTSDVRRGTCGGDELMRPRAVSLAELEALLGAD